MGAESGMEQIDPAKGRRMIERIVRFEKRNLKTKQHLDREVVRKIKEIIREEANAYVD